MKKCIATLLLLGLLLSGCDMTKKPETRPPDIEPTAVYDWMAGESPVALRRLGVWRYGTNNLHHAISPAGTYFIDGSFYKGNINGYILYADHGSDTLVKLCGRSDCTHDNADCNAYVREGTCISYYNGYLYALSGEGSDEFCQLIRMEPDGSEHMTAIDLLEFVKELDGDFVGRAIINDGVLIFDAYYWEVTIVGQEIRKHGCQLDTYYYKLDGSMEKPELMDATGMYLYSCGNLLLVDSLVSQYGGEYSSLFAWDADTNTQTYLTETTGHAGYFDEDEGYFFRDGCIWRKTYSDNQETIMLDTGLEGDYSLCPYPDCLMVISKDVENPDPNLYIYNWNYELVDTVKLNYSYDCRTLFLLIAETAERFILTDEYKGIPKYYINKSELGTGDVEIHEFEYAE